jgi:hypothetical protein
MLQRGDSVPHLEVRTIGGELFDYSTIWQRHNLVLVAMPAAESQTADNYISRLMALTPDCAAKGAECVITRDRMSAISSPGVVVADKWGEVVHVATASNVDDLTAPEELLDWLDFVNARCPECEGEAK